MRYHRFVGLLGVVCFLAAPLWAQGQDEPKPARVDALGDPLPKGAITRIGTARLANLGGPTGLAFSPDGKSLASEDGNGVVHLWEAATGKEIRAMKPPVAGWGPLAFAPDGKTIASAAGRNLVCLWEVETGRLLRRLEDQGDNRSICFSHDSRLLAAGAGNGNIILWEPATGKVLHTLKGHQASPNGLAFTPDDKTLVSTGHDGSTRVWDLADGKETVKFAPNPLANSSIVLATIKGDRIAISAGGMNSDGILRYWDLDKKKQVRQIQAHKNGALCLAISKNGKVLVSGGYDRCIRIWDTESTAEIGSVPEQPEQIHQLALSPAGDLVAWGGGSRIRIAKLNADPKAFQFKELFERSGHDDAVRAIQFSHDGKKLLTTGQISILWDELTGKELHRFNKGWVSAWSADSKLLAFADPNDNLQRAIHLYDADTGKQTGRISAPTQVMSLAFVPDHSAVIITGSDHTVHLLELATGKVRLSTKSQPDGLWRVVPAPDGYTVAAVCNKDVRIFDTIAGTEIAKVPARGQRVQFSPDGSVLACATYQDGILLWDLAKGKELHRIQTRTVFDMAFTPDGRIFIAACMDETIRFWEVASGKEIHSFVGHKGWIMSVAVSPDGRTLVSGGIDTTMLLWPLDRFNKGKLVRAPRLSPEELKARLAKLPAGTVEKWWEDLGDNDAGKGYRAIWGLVGAPKETLAILEKWTGPICKAPIYELIADLENADRREEATIKLERLGRLARPALKAALAGKLSAEPRRRIERMLALNEVEEDGPDEGLRLLRAGQVLEHIGTPEARALLELLARGSPMPESADHAKAALARLKKASP
jgi:WD40 repeat protein